jgi:hypothetical protein
MGQELGELVEPRLDVDRGPLDASRQACHDDRRGTRLLAGRIDGENLRSRDLASL